MSKGFKGTVEQWLKTKAQNIHIAAPQRERIVYDANRGGTVNLDTNEFTPATTGGKPVGPKSAIGVVNNLTPKETQLREAKYPQATQAVKTFESHADQLAAQLETLADHPGLSGITGLVYGRTPALTKEANAADALLKTIMAKGGFSSLQDQVLLAAH